MFRSIDRNTLSSGTPAASSARTANRIMISGPHQERGGRGRIEPCPADEIGHDPDVSHPAPGRSIHRNLNLDVEPCPPHGQFPGEQQVGGCAGAVQEHEPPVAVAVGEDLVDGRAQRGQPDAASDDHHVAAFGLPYRPVRAVRPSHADQLAGLEGTQRMR